MRRLRGVSLVAAVAMLLVAFSPTLDRLADASFAWHMVQHLLLLFVVPPLYLGAAPFETIGRRLSRAQAVALTRALRSAPVRALTFPPVCLALYVFALWITHLTPLYDAALGNVPLHVAEHGLYLLAGVLFWMPVIGVPPLTPVSYPAKLLYLFLAMPQCAFLGAALYNARTPLYPHYIHLESFAGALTDQANAAAVMWICGGLIVFAVMLCVVAAWGTRERTSLLTFAALLLLSPLAANASPERGRNLYQLSCASCHGERGQGSPRAPALIGKSGADIHLMLDTGRMPAASVWEDEVHKQPAFSPGDIAAIVAYVRSFALQADVTLPVVRPGDANRGRLLFAANCAHCHGAGGQGASTGYDIVAPSLLRASAFQVAEAIRAGPLLMPRFGRDVLSDRDVDDIAQYVATLQTAREGEHSVNAGGISLGDVGPVAEGLIGWLVGLGAIVLFVRFIGTAD